MYGIHGRPFLDLDPLLPELALLDLEGIELELASSERSHNLWGHAHPRDFSFHRQPPTGSSQRVQDFYAQRKSNQHEVQLYAKLAYGVYSPAMSVRVAHFKGDFSRMSQLTVDDPTLWERDRSVFPSVHEFIDSVNIFTSTGRINFLIQEHQCEIPMHNDWVHANANGKVGFNAPAEKEFLWINLRQDKKLYVWDERLKVKHTIESKCSWFNSLDLHGGPPRPTACWSLRIDGRFTPEFRQRLADHYGNQ